MKRVFQNYPEIKEIAVVLKGTKTILIYRLLFQNSTVFFLRVRIQEIN